MDPEKDEGAVVIDLVRYKIEKAIMLLPLDSMEREMNESILDLYEAGTVTVAWSGDDMWVSMADGSSITPDILGIPADENGEFEVVYRDADDYTPGTGIEFTPDFSDKRKQ